MVLPLAAAAFALQAGSTVASFVGGRSQAGAANRHQAEVNRINADYRYEVMRYQNDVWKQDLDYANEVLEYSRDEFGNQRGWAERAMAAAEQNRNADAFTLMVRGIEETIAATFQTTNVQRAGQAARASFAACERGVEGNSTEAVLGDIWRQEGEANTITELNRQNTLNQLEREGIAADAQADQQMFQIASSIRTFAPNAPIRTPEPRPALTPQAPVQGPSGAALATGLWNAASNSLGLYNNLTGQNARQTFEQLSAFAGRTFRIGSPGQPVSAAPLAPGIG